MKLRPALIALPLLVLARSAAADCSAASLPAPSLSGLAVNGFGETNAGKQSGWDQLEAHGWWSYTGGNQFANITAYTWSIVQTGRWNGVGQPEQSCNLTIATGSLAPSAGYSAANCGGSNHGCPWHDASGSWVGSWSWLTNVLGVDAGTFVIKVTTTMNTTTTTLSRTISYNPWSYITPGNPSSGYNVGHIKIHVKKSDGTPVAGTTLDWYVGSFVSTRKLTTVTTDQNGYATLPNVSPNRTDIVLVQYPVNSGSYQFIGSGVGSVGGVTRLYEVTVANSGSSAAIDAGSPTTVADTSSGSTNTGGNYNGPAADAPFFTAEWWNNLFKGLFQPTASKIDQFHADVTQWQGWGPFGFGQQIAAAWSAVTLGTDPGDCTGPAGCDRRIFLFNWQYGTVGPGFLPGFEDGVTNGQVPFMVDLRPLGSDTLYWGATYNGSVLGSILVALRAFLSLAVYGGFCWLLVRRFWPTVTA